MGDLIVEDKERAQQLIDIIKRKEQGKITDPVLLSLIKELDKDLDDARQDLDETAEGEGQQELSQPQVILAETWGGGRGIKKNLLLTKQHVIGKKKPNTDRRVLTKYQCEGQEAIYLVLYRDREGRQQLYLTSRTGTHRMSQEECDTAIAILLAYRHTSLANQTVITFSNKKWSGLHESIKKYSDVMRHFFGK